MNARRQPLSRALLAGLILLASAATAHADTFVVDPGGGGNFLTIQAGIDGVSPGDVLQVVAGVYVEDLIIDKSLTIDGAGAGLTVVHPATSVPGTGPGSQVETTTWCIRIQASNVGITNLTVDGDNPGLPSATDARGGIITDYSTGTYSDMLVVACDVRNVLYRGIYAAAGGSGHMINNNTVANVNTEFLDSVGIFFFGALGQAHDNVVDNCSVAIGFQGGGGGSFEDNVISNSDLGLLCNGSDAPVMMQANTVTDCEQGIQSIAVSTSVDLLENTVLRCGTGITIFGNPSGIATVLADTNTLDGEDIGGTTGMYITSDLTPFGHGPLDLDVLNNTMIRHDVGVVIDEDPTNDQIIDVTLSGAASTFNVLAGNASLNLQLEGCNDDIDATHNAWGVIKPALIEPTVHHQVDDPLLGLASLFPGVNFIITVDDDPGADFTTINAAIAALLPGGTIEVAPGLYVEDVAVDRSCSIEGSGTDPDPLLGTVIQGASNDEQLIVVSVAADDVALSDLRIDGQQPVFLKARRGVFAAGVSGLSVTDSVIETCTFGISYNGSTGGSFHGNEILDFGEDLVTGSGILVRNSDAVVGTPGTGNYVHDGLSPGIAVVLGSADVTGNRSQACPVGFLTESVVGPTSLLRNTARLCDQGYQSIGNTAPVNYDRNGAQTCETGFTLFGVGSALHTYTDNTAIGAPLSPTASNVFLSTGSSVGDGDLHAVFRGNVLTASNFGVVLDESFSSQPFLMDADLSGAGNPNWITGNNFFEIVLDACNDPIGASGNYFGSAAPVVVEGKIVHQVDSPGLGLVDFSGLLPPGPDLRVRGELVSGFDLTVITTATPGNLVFHVLGIAPGLLPTPFGPLLLDPGFLIFIPGVPTPGSGMLAFGGQVTQPVPSGVGLYIQNMVTPGLPSGVLTNADSAVAP